jgi:hypothetical protein
MYTEPRRTVRTALYVGLLMAFPLMASAQGYSNPSSGTRGYDMSSGTTSDTGTSTNESQSTGYGPTTNGFALVDVWIYPEDSEIFVDGQFMGFARDFNNGEEELKLRPGTHVIVLYHPERRTVRMEVRAVSGRSYMLNNNMPNLEEGEIAVRPLAALFKIFRQDFDNHEIKPLALSAATS